MKSVTLKEFLVSSLCVVNSKYFLMLLLIEAKSIIIYKIFCQYMTDGVQSLRQVFQIATMDPEGL